MKEVGFDPLHRWVSQGLRLSDRGDDTLRSADDTNSFTMLVARAVGRIDPGLVVDLGCGCGIPTIEAAARGVRDVRGIDISAANVALARRNVARARLTHRVHVHCADWSAWLQTAAPDLIVANPPYVPNGIHPAVDGGMDGADVIRAMVDAVPESTRSLALQFGSISNPVSVVRHIEERGWRIQWMFGHVVPFGLYTDTPATIAVLRALRQEKRAWFHEQETGLNGALRTYVVLGAIAEREMCGSPLADAMTDMLTKFQSGGLRGLRHAVMPIPFRRGVYRTPILRSAVLPRRANAMPIAKPRHDAAQRNNQRVGRSERRITDPGSAITVETPPSRRGDALLAIVPVATDVSSPETPA